MTCTPYGINTHRLLVRGVRVDGSANAYVPADAYQIEPNGGSCDNHYDYRHHDSDFICHVGSKT